MNPINNAQFIGSFTQSESCPDSQMPEYAFIGRSNVGKSTLINYITGRKTLAKVSRTPGKTQLINYFLINNTWHLVDLPGYGYARVSKTMRSSFEKMIKTYLEKRTQLSCLFVLLDGSIGPQKIDMEFIGWLGKKQIPFSIIYTKTDRETKNKIHANIKAIQQELSKNWAELPKQFVSSSTKDIGKDDILNFIQEINEQLL